MEKTGILAKTKSAETKSGISREVEQIKLAITATFLENYETGNIPFNDLKDELNKYKDIKNVEGVNTIDAPTQIVSKVNKKINLGQIFIPVSYAEETTDFKYAKITYKSERIYYVILKDDSKVGQIFVETEAVDRTGINIGDYINYQPDNTSSTTYSKNNLVSTYSGSSNTEDFTRDTLDWQVLRIYLDGSLDLIGSPTTQSLRMSGKEGYTNGEYLLNDICRTLYSREGIIARSVNISDFEYWLEKSNSGVTNRANYCKDTQYQYNNEVTYTGNSDTDNNFYPSSYNTPSLGLTNSNSISMIQNGDLTLKSISYNLVINEDNYSEGYKALTNDFTWGAWVASRGVLTHEYARFGLFTSTNHFVEAPLVSSLKNTGWSGNSHIRPVVHLTAATKITENEGTKNKPHTIIKY